MKKFPNVIHVTREGEDTRDEYLAIRADGVADTDFAETTPVAIYKLVEVGQVKVTRQFESKPKPRRR